MGLPDDTTITARTDPNRLPFSGRSWAWVLVVGLLVTDLCWSARIGLTVGGWWKSILATGAMLALSALYRRRSRAIADTADHAALWISFSVAGCVLTYLCATWALPLHDAALTRIDLAMDFDWPAWRDAMLAWAPLRWTLALAYACLLPQILLSALYFPIRGSSERGIELLLLAALTLLPTAVISGLIPALGPFATFGGEKTAYLPDVMALRAGGPWHFDLIAMQGIVTMPSYHAVLAALFAYAYRGTGPLGWGIAALNGVMLLSIAPIGGHYLADILGGGAIAALAILTARRVARRRPVMQGAALHPLGTSPQTPFC